MQVLRNFVKIKLLIEIKILFNDNEFTIFTNNMGLQSSKAQ